MKETILNLMYVRELEDAEEGQEYIMFLSIPRVMYHLSEALFYDYAY